MRFRPLECACAILLLASSPLFGQNKVQIFPLSQVQPGLKGVGQTTFEGNTVSEFQVEILGVLRNALAPKQDLILARLSGGPLAETGVIAGMSGSPVYINGKLVGAVSRAFPFAKEPLAGITPIEEMLDVVPGTSPPAPLEAAQATYRIVGGSTGAGNDLRLIPSEEQGETIEERLENQISGGNPAANLQLPLRYSGFSSEAMQEFAPLFQKMGFEPMAGGGLTGSPSPDQQSAAPKEDKIVAGSMISVLLVDGDFNLNVDCTVTLVQSENLYACGHQFLLTGAVQFPFAPARVLATVPSLASSFRVDSPGQPVGSIRQDRFGAIYGVMGEKAPMIPVHIDVDSTLNRKDVYNFDVVQQGFLSPLLMNLAIVSSLGSTERMVGPATLSLKGQIRLSNGDAVNLEDVASGDVGAPNILGNTVAQPISYLLDSGFPDARIAGVNLTVVSQSKKRIADIEQVWCTKSEVKPGDKLEVIVLLRSLSGESVIERIPVKIPDSVDDKTLSLVVGSGPSINAIQNRFTPLGGAVRNIHQLVRALNRMRTNNRVYALLMAPKQSFVLDGEEYPSPPPSLLQTFQTGPAQSSSVIFSGTSVVGDFETQPGPYAITGQKTLLLKVTANGM